ncbi:hypothetical protein FIBSPDRAFT_859411 [Athelia psychrophila]|uniref:Uncharacterized protein n=1 Tax=Athelia psychrophila TaxID=1759441 RepID=A0A166L767_9AGAM|nr:hypothetical protein FIBSPDRAFT_859411 [Fibularhizoctonia sp. CBS 109695]
MFHLHSTTLACQHHAKQRARQSLDHSLSAKLPGPVPVCSRSVPSDSSTPARVSSGARSPAPVEDDPSAASDQTR